MGPIMSRDVSFLGIRCKFLQTGLVAGTLIKLYFHFHSNRMGYNYGVSFPFDFERNEIPFGSKLKRKLPPRSYPNQFERKWKYSFLSV